VAEPLPSQAVLPIFKYLALWILCPAQTPTLIKAMAVKLNLELT
jgi:hypothetical protein